MNTSKQVNVMVGLLMVFLVSTLLYFLWDDDRASEAESRQLFTNAERGGALYSLNCRACHGLNGKGPLESGIIPGAPLDSDDPYRLQDAGTASRAQRYRDTIRCGRVGTVMPPWAQDQGGALNDFQILQLVTLITSTASEEGWDFAIEQANHTDAFKPAKHLAEAVGAGDTTFVLNNSRGLRAGNLLRIDDEPVDEIYEVVTIVDAPAGTVLTEKATKDATELTVQEAPIFNPGDMIIVGSETIEVVKAPAQTTLSAVISVSATSISVFDPLGLAADDLIKVDGEKMEITSVSGTTVKVTRGAEDTKATEHTADALVTEQGNVIEVRRAQDGTSAASHDVKTEVIEIGDSIKVERAAFSTKAAEHPEGAEVFNGPILPGNTITGEPGTSPPCGQKAAVVTTPAPVEVIEISGDVEIGMGDNFFEIDGNQNPTLQIASGATVKVTVKNNGAAVHNMVTTGADGTFGTDDDQGTDPLAVPAGNTGVVEISFDKPGTYQYQCQFHPVDMLGDITVP